MYGKMPMELSGKGPNFNIKAQERVQEAIKLFPEHPAVEWRRNDVAETPGSSLEELQQACRNIKLGKCQGPDEIPNEMREQLQEERRSIAYG